MLNLAKFCFQKPKTSQTTLICRERGFFTERPKVLNGIEMHVGALYALNSINSKL